MCKISGRDLTTRDSCLSNLMFPECICTTFQTSTHNVPLSYQSSAPAWPPWPLRWRVRAKAAESDGKNSKTKWETNHYGQAFYLPILSRTPSETEDKNFGSPKDRSAEPGSSTRGAGCTAAGPNRSGPFPTRKTHAELRQGTLTSTGNVFNF